ncbi:hypothetical protein [Lysinibacillus mangiferihumi]|nr:hypothetical protein [Lysinibacillus mangiferihumi]
MLNFDFLKDKLPFNSFANACFKAEKAMQVSQATVAILSCFALHITFS